MKLSTKIWVTGLLASAIIGAFIGGQLGPWEDGDTYGALGGMLAFACVRLWLVEIKSKGSPAKDTRE
jgi:uncharacterized membrane protein YfcA